MLQALIPGLSTEGSTEIVGKKPRWRLALWMSDWRRSAPLSGLTDNGPGVMMLKVHVAGRWWQLSEKYTARCRPHFGRLTAACARLVHSFVPSHCGQLVQVSGVRGSARKNVWLALKSQ